MIFFVLITAHSNSSLKKTIQTHVMKMLRFAAKSRLQEHEIIQRDGPPVAMRDGVHTWQQVGSEGGCFGAGDVAVRGGGARKEPHYHNLTKKL